MMAELIDVPVLQNQEQIVEQFRTSPNAGRLLLDLYDFFEDLRFRRLGPVAFHRSTRCWVNAFYGCLVHSALVHGLP